MQSKSGDTLDLTAPAGGFTVDTPTAVGGIIGVPATTGAVGESVAVDVEGQITMPKLASLALAEGAECYFDPSAGTVSDKVGGAFVGYAAAAAAAADSTVEVKLVQRTAGARVIFLDATYSEADRGGDQTVGSDTDPKVFATQLTIPGGLIPSDLDGDPVSIEIMASGVIDDQNGTDTAQFRLKIGSTVLAETNAVDVADGAVFWLVARIRPQTAVRSAVQEFASLTGGNPVESSQQAVNLTWAAAQTVTVEAEWGAGNASNKATIHQLGLKLYRTSP
jgi:predicted RecA/RadA family phage recombinase